MSERRPRPQPIAVPEDPLLEALLEFALEAEREFQRRRAERKLRIVGGRRHSRRDAA